jgi:hypothetical protein
MHKMEWIIDNGATHSNDMVDLITNSSDQSDTVIYCANCENGDTLASGGCLDCIEESTDTRKLGLPLCIECQLIHSKFRAYKSHRLLSLADFIRERLNIQQLEAVNKLSVSPASHRLSASSPTTAIIAQSSTTKKCSLHPAEDIKFFCDNCNILICPDCVLVHSGHVLMSINEGAKKQKAQLASLCEKSISYLKELQKERLYIVKGIEELKSTKLSLTATIDSEVQRIILIVQKKREEALNLINTFTLKNTTILEELEDTIQNILSTGGEKVELISKAVNDDCDHQIVFSENIEQLKIELLDMLNDLSTNVRLLTNIYTFESYRLLIISFFSSPEKQVRPIRSL